MHASAPTRTCPYYTATLNHCGIRFSPTEKGKGMQAAVCLSEKHSACKFFKAQARKTALHVLLLDDHMDEHRDLAAALQQRAQCTIAITPAQAVTAYMQSIKSKEYYDAVIVNAQLTETDGLETVEAIRQFEKGTLGVSEGIFIILLCDDAVLEHDVRTALQVCCVTKDADLTKVLAAIERDLVQCGG